MDKLQQIRLPIVKEFEEFKSLFDASLQSSNPLLSEVLTYIKQRNGKMMRPILTLLMAKLFGDFFFDNKTQMLSHRRQKTSLLFSWLIIPLIEQRLLSEFGRFK